MVGDLAPPTGAPRHAPGPHTSFRGPSAGTCSPAAGPHSGHSSTASPASTPTATKDAYLPQDRHRSLMSLLSWGSRWHESIRRIAAGECVNKPGVSRVVVVRSSRSNVDVFEIGGKRRRRHRDEPNHDHDPRMDSPIKDSLHDALPAPF